jgi:phage terminase large subunit
MVSAHLSIIPEFLEKIILLGYENTFSVNKAEVVNLKNKSDILFRGIKTSAGNQTASLKSLQGVRTWVLDEAEELIDEDIFDTIDLSIREKNIQNRIILILNP